MLVPAFIASISSELFTCEVVWLEALLSVSTAVMYTIALSSYLVGFTTVALMHGDQTLPAWIHAGQLSSPKLVRRVGYSQLQVIKRV